MEAHPGSFSLQGEARQATMFFSDVAGFTTISESLTPEKLVQLLNAYLTPMTEIVMNSQGYVDKYEGDAIMAEWGVPFPSDKHAQLACHAALDQQVKLAEIREDLFQRFGHRLFVRMGLNSGTVSAGNMGSTRRFSYTVMGDAVNQAARFEPANKDYGTDIMIGNLTYELARDHIESRLLDKLVVKGKTEPILIHELIGKKGQITADKAEIVALYVEALKVHWARDFDGALERLRKVLHIDPADGPAKAFIARIEEYKVTPPPAAWKGEFVRTKKD
jgi:adenylate cyclase